MSTQNMMCQCCCFWQSPVQATTTGNTNWPKPLSTARAAPGGNFNNTFFMIFDFAQQCPPLSYHTLRNKIEQMVLLMEDK